MLGDEALLSLQISRRSAVVSSATAIVGSIHASVYFQVRASANASWLFLLIDFGTYTCHSDDLVSSICIFRERACALAHTPQQVLESIELSERRRILAHVEEVIVTRRLWRHERLGHIYATMERQRLITMQLTAPTGKSAGPAAARSASAEPDAAGKSVAELGVFDRAHSSLGMALPLPSFMRPADAEPSTSGRALDEQTLALRQGSVIRVSGLPWWAGELALRIGFESELGLRPRHVLVCTGKGRRGVGTAYVLLDSAVSLEHEPTRVSLSAIGNARLLLHTSSEVCYTAAFKQQQARGTASDTAARRVKAAVDIFDATFTSAGSVVQRVPISDSTRKALQFSGFQPPVSIDLGEPSTTPHWAVV